MPGGRGWAARLVLAAVALGGLGVAAAAAASPKQCTDRWDDLVKHGQAGARSYQVFMQGCLGGAATSLPIGDAPAGAPTGATARCRDGTYTAAAAPQDACEAHRGVAMLLRGP